VPSLARDLLEQISFEARESEYIDNKSGVSARMSISALENLMSTAERRALLAGLDKTNVRLSDFMGIVPAITGKVELVYEGEQEGAAFVAQQLIGSAIQRLFPTLFPKIEKLNKQNAVTPYSALMESIFAEGGLVLLDDCTDKEYQDTLDSVKPLTALIEKYQGTTLPEDIYFLKEFVLWGLVEYHKLSKDRLENGFQFKDLLDIL
jgi:magnesium chelatase subunit I